MTLREALEGVNDSLWSDGQVSIRPIQTEADLIYANVDCQLTEAQRDLVNPAWFSIGRAYLFREDNLPCLIYADEQPVGFISLGKWLAKGDAWSWSFYVDKAHQGKGYGRRAARLAIRLLKAADAAKPIKLATERDNQRAQSLYASLGFQLLPERDGDDLVFGL
jgi:diamine N-acetyltransferase